MTDEDQNLTPARPVAPRRRAPNTQMAQPMKKGAPPPPPQPAMPPPPAPVHVEPVRLEPVLQPEPLELELEPAAPPKPVAPTSSVPAPTPAPAAVASAAPVASNAPVPVSATQPEPAAQPVRPAAPVAPGSSVAPAAPVDEPQLDFPRTIKDTLRKVDDSFGAFRAAAMRFPSERMNERIAEDTWTRKQMLQHVAAWHDLTADRLIKLINTGQPAPLDRDTDQFNASVARQAIGKTSGEVLKDIDATFNRLRRQLARMTDAQLEQDDWWAAWVVGGNTYGHYEEHWADIYTPELPQGGGRSRR